MIPFSFTFPTVELAHFDHIRANSSTYGGSEDVLDEYDGVLSYYRQIRRFEDATESVGSSCSTPMSTPWKWNSPVAQMGEIRPLPPEEAWRLTRELDEFRETRYPIEVEPGSALP